MKCSYIKLDAQTVLNACVKLREKIQEKRDQRVEDLVEEMMNRRFFKCHSREEAIGKIKKKQAVWGMSMTEWDWIYEMTYSCQEDCAEELERIAKSGCKHNTDVYVSSDHIKYIEKYL